MTALDSFRTTLTLFLHTEANGKQKKGAKEYRNVEPRYQQITLDTSDRHNKLQQILSPNADDAGVWIHQDAWFHMGNLDKGIIIDYNRKKEGNGLYVFVIKGNIKVDGQELEKRDGLGITDFDKVTFEATEDNEILLMEVPMG